MTVSAVSQELTVQGRESEPGESVLLGRAIQGRDGVDLWDRGPVWCGREGLWGFR